MPLASTQNKVFSQPLCHKMKAQWVSLLSKSSTRQSMQSSLHFSDSRYRSKVLIRKDGLIMPFVRISCFLRSSEVNPHSGAFVYQFQWLSLALPSSSSSFWNIPNSHQKQASRALIWVWVGYGAPMDGSPSTWDFPDGINVWSNQASFSLSCFPTCDWSFHMNLTFLSE